MLLLLPTDTCYGLAGNFSHEDFEAINTLKGRDDTKRLAMLVEDFEDMKKYVIISDEQIEFLRKYPHPWSFLGRRNPTWEIPEWMNPIKYEKISLRVARVCLSQDEGQLKYPLFLTSANLSGMPESKTIEEAKVYFPGISGIDGGLCNNPPSDIFSLSDSGEIIYLRKNY